ncbi:hypothetical protein KHA80_19915 [Anaerobacillus sp. HL2]|nr:hypothetical protein KHA80_19915 [Anaerobacillus sp. HL2]
MQVSIPRSQSAGKLQDSGSNKRSQVAQDQMGLEQNKEDEKKSENKC